MTALLSPVRAIDRHLQATVDWCAFWLMRRGLTKGQIRWAISVAFVLSNAVGIAATWGYQADHPWHLALVALWTTLIVAGAELTAEKDRQAERAGMASRADDESWGDTGWKVFAVVFAVVSAFHSDADVVAWCTHLQAEVYRWTNVAFFVAFAIQLYLKRTPRTPPPLERTAREPVTA